jgi:hypothetical protein
MVSWAALLQEAVTKPGYIHEAYSRFHVSTGLKAGRFIGLEGATQHKSSLSPTLQDICGKRTH